MLRPQYFQMAIYLVASLEIDHLQHRKTRRRMRLELLASSNLLKRL